MNKFFKNGQKCILQKGDVARYVDLPGEPIAVIAYNHTANTTTCLISCGGEPIQEMTLPANARGGQVCVINPAVSQAYEVAILLDGGAHRDACIEVFLVSTFLPSDQKTLNTKEIKPQGNKYNFKSNSRLYFTPTIADVYTFTMNTIKYGQMGLLLDGRVVIVVGLKIPQEAQSFLKETIHIGAGMSSSQVFFSMSTGTRWHYNFYGMQQPIVYVPVSNPVIGWMSVLSQNSTQIKPKNSF